MSLHATCPICGHQYKLLPQQAGKKLKCKYCEGIVEAPAAPTAAPTAAAARSAPVAAPRVRATPPAPSRAVEPAPAADDPYDVASTPEVPAAPRTRLPQQPIPYRSPRTGYESSPMRRKAGINCIVLSVLGYLGGTCLGLAGILFGAVGGMAAKGGGAGAGAHAGAPAMGGVLVGLGVVIFIMAAVLLGVATTYLVCGIYIRRGGYASVMVALVLASVHELLCLIGLAAGLMQMAAGNTNIMALLFQAAWVVGLGQLIYQLIQILREPRVELA